MWTFLLKKIENKLGNCRPGPHAFILQLCIHIEFMRKNKISFIEFNYKKFLKMRQNSQLL